MWTRMRWWWVTNALMQSSLTQRTTGPTFSNHHRPTLPCHDLYQNYALEKAKTLVLAHFHRILLYLYQPGLYHLTVSLLHCSGLKYCWACNKPPPPNTQHMPRLKVRLSFKEEVSDNEIPSQDSCFLCSINIHKEMGMALSDNSASVM